MQPITTPYSLELGKNEQLKDVVVGAAQTVTAGKIKIFVGGSIDPAKRQSIVGALQACQRVRLPVIDSDFVVSCDLDATADSLDAAADPGNITDSKVAIIYSASFGTEGETHFQKETIDQLISAFLQNSAGT